MTAVVALRELRLGSMVEVAPLATRVPLVKEGLRPHERVRAWKLFDGLLRHTARTLRRMVGTVFATEDFVAVNRAGGSDFYVFATLEGGEDALARLQRYAIDGYAALEGRQR